MQAEKVYFPHIKGQCFTSFVSNVKKAIGLWDKWTRLFIARICNASYTSTQRSYQTLEERAQGLLYEMEYEMTRTILSRKIH